ncbi:MAG: hypothetical protein A3I11_04505 [Elusimicrobia bacterium RIFCSPLOWO2_02_FULL_39_32]|nr:MAG: hypothetical protein A2034_00730 [Elusimicrobia bacterium GWA2_38_7]OGR79627.1 MAG: hypothetical protein A3B80_03075 [Elusimicrobia bacterium RIFCSPHIGHO2_02_FULL_39_36]OGR92954.1 MAG: hypothetical protein A3I11_04505 [Elusimicrobia bacterium RIFCSPLOWO2_02_FULL_39_32]OGR99737.1 MAG: hypothetical protein A3G85_01865 [Elusimicrobia bacterium RIFCSPLOWO2_12_FULL_39_28]
MNREQLFRFFFLGVFLFILYQILHILSPFYTGILGAIVLTLIFFPLHRLILKKIGVHRANLSSGISTILVMALIVFPFIFFSWLLFKELTDIYPTVKRFSDLLSTWHQGGSFLHIPGLEQLEIKLDGLLSLVQLNLQAVLTGLSKNLISFAANIGKHLPKYALILMINVLVMIFTMFFLFRDGPSLFHKFKELVPMDEKHKDLISTQLYLTVTGVVRGVFIVAVVQGTLAGVGYFFAGVPSPVVLGFSTIFTALIPLVGPAAIWLPISIYYLVQGALGQGLFMLFWGIFVVSLVDNFLRPILIGSRAKLPILFLFFGLLGGVKVYGPMGIFLGPLVIALLIAFVRIYKEEYSQKS